MNFKTTFHLATSRKIKWILVKMVTTPKETVGVHISQGFTALPSLNPDDVKVAKSLAERDSKEVAEEYKRKCEVRKELDDYKFSL